MRLPPEQEAIRAKCFHPSGTFIEFPIEDVESSIPERFEKMVRLYPNRIAVRTGDEVVTYAQLNAMANSMARRIVSERGAEPEPIGLLIDMGVDQIAAMLGVLKAGKFFVLLDPSFPLKRNSAILEDTCLRLVLVDAKNTPYASKLKCTIFSVIKLESIGDSSASDELNIKISPDALSNVVYTSGSTGQPKGVMQTHRSKMHLVMLHTQISKMTSKDRNILLTSGTANTIGNSLYALLNGAALHPYDVNEHGISKLAEWMIEKKITVCAISAPLFRKLCESLTGIEGFPALRFLRLTSEASYKSDFELYKRFFPRTCTLANVMCPTEAGTLRQFIMDHDSQLYSDEIPLGYPVNHKEIILVDEDGKEVGHYEVGEIVVRSRYLSAGYWRRPELNEAKFKADPHDADQRVFYTGDLGLMLPDGCLIHKGRKDFRVKIRGYGVETGEVERVLRSHAAVKDCVVVGQRGESGDTKLVGYYTSETPLPPNVSELRRFLSGSLPDYMVPSLLMKLDAIPLTPNGKVDRRALPEPGGYRPELEMSYLAPRTDVETIVAQIFAECTGVERVGIADNFFELGGNSLILTRLLSRLNVTFKREFSVQELFEAPSVTGIARLLESSAQLAPANAEPVCSPMWKHTRLPLSYPQQRLWFLDQLEPGNCTYNLLSAYRLKGYLNVTALEQSFNEIIRRHEILRTVFKAEDGNPVQIVLPHLAGNIPLLDLRGGSADESWNEVRRLFTQEAQRPFDLAAGPLMRLTLLQLGNDDYVLVRARHHIVSDGWSEGVLFYELGEIYQALSIGQSSPLVDLPVQYANYARWQRDWLTGKRFESQLSYWKKKLDNVATLNLPTDHPRRAFRARRGRRQYYVLSERLTLELKKFSCEHGATLFMTLVAAFQTLLHRYTKQTDVVIGTPTAGRNREEFEGLIGFFLNMLALRLDLSGNPTFAEALHRARDMCLGALSHQELPFEKLVEEMHPDRGVAQNPLFQVTFAFQNTPRVLPNLTGLVVEDLEIDTGIGGFDLHLFMEEIGGHLQGYWIYDTELFGADTIERMVGHLQTLLRGIVADPDRRLSDLPLLTEPERQQLLVGWNDTKRDYPKDKCIHELFEAQVEKAPDAIAVVFGDQQLSYRGLNNRANQLAHHLKKLGISPDMLVGICLERSVEMIVGLLAILKAGGAYVPLDPSYPKARLGLMLEDTHAGIVLTDRVSLKSLPATGARVICLDQDWEEIAKEPQFNPSSQCTAGSLAYVIYTSGSTGEPKGVEVRHQGVARLLFGVDYVQLDETQTFIHLAPISFDAATFEVWGALLHGGKCVLFPGNAPNPRELGEVLKKHRVSTLWLTAALFNTVIDEGPQALSEVKQLLIGGEALSVPHVKRGLAQLPNTTIINGYGPTESTTFTCCYRIPRQLDDNLSSIPIGRPIGNTQIYILDRHRNPVSIGVVGEIYIGGDGVARGYLNQPELTAERFIADPFSTEPGARLYKTGDLARYLPNGDIEFLGRGDNQVKLRGYRIELGEIESVLGQHKAVQSSVVMAREDAPGDKRLVGYVVMQPGESFDAVEVRRYLQQKLPEYMIPSRMVVLDELPISPSGKVDRNALPAPDQDRLELGNVSQAPRTPTEVTLAAIWGEVLKLDKVGIYDNFFELGGHSLLATQVISRIRSVLSTDLPLRHMFESPTVAELAAMITKTHSKQAGDAELGQMLLGLEVATEEDAEKMLAASQDQQRKKYEHE